jgi:transcription elongation GreA/GreB family factor
LRMAYSLLIRLSENLNEDSELAVEGSVLKLKNLKTKTERYYILLPKEGGVKVEFENQIFYSLSSTSPLGAELIGRKQGEDFEVEIDSKFYLYRIEELH